LKIDSASFPTGFLKSGLGEFRAFKLYELLWKGETSKHHLLTQILERLVVPSWRMGIYLDQSPWRS
jgi:hypothetical protein